jgi:hypothetical protein
MTEPVPSPLQKVSNTALHAALEQALSRHFGASRRIVKLERSPSSYCSSFAVEELEVWLDDDTALGLVFKDLSRTALLGQARQVKPAFLYDPLREIETYESILTPYRLGTATCYGSVVDREAESYWLFLEKVPGLELYQIGEFAVWQQVARWLAVMHTRFAGETESLMRAARLLRYDGDFYRLWLHRAQAFLRQTEPLRPKSVWRRVERLAARYDQVIERLVALPPTFIHGEFYASNVLVQETSSDELRVCPIDWEMAAVGPGLIDLAALIAGGWTDEEKRALASSYHAALSPHSGWRPTPDAFLYALECCQLHLAVQWLGWSSEWLPPPEHAHNWLSEALYLAEKLGLS